MCIQILTIAGFAQNLKISVATTSENPSKMFVRGVFSENVEGENLSFLSDYADAVNLGQRVKNVQLFDKNAQKIGYKKIAEGSFIADAFFNSFSYETDISISTNTLSTAHISWISDQKGILRLNDLLPLFEKKYRTEISFELPAKWKISTVEKKTTQNSYAVENTENAAFIVGENWNENSFNISGTNVNLILDDQWKIEKSVAEKIIRDILSQYTNYFGAIPQKKINIVNFKFPKDVGFERWRAETFGANIIVMTAPTTFESQMRQRIQEQLRHELFHLWMPNDLALDGDYAWFYEGFAQYAALRSGIALNQISFADFLNTLEQANNLGNRRSQTVSLIDASKNRWLGEGSSVYAKGLAVAFLLDVALLRQSGGKRDLISVLRQIYEKHRFPNETEDGNSAVLKIFAGYNELSPIIEDYVKGSEKLSFAKYLAQTGIEILPDKSGVKLQVKNKLSGREKDFLDKLGYNNWRKFLSK